MTCEAGLGADIFAWVFFGGMLLIRSVTSIRICVIIWTKVERIVHQIMTGEDWLS
jgi:hypothetical protein